MALLVRSMLSCRNGRLPSLARKCRTPWMVQRSVPMATSAPEEMKEYWEKNDRLKRPVSPHLTIYKPQITWMLSLLHRATGIAMYGELVIASAAFLTMSADFPTMLEWVKSLELAAPILWSAKALFAFPIVFHLMNGAFRHLAWDYAIGVELPAIYKTGWTVFGLSFVFSAILASL